MPHCHRCFLLYQFASLRHYSSCRSQILVYKYAAYQYQDQPVAPFTEEWIFSKLCCASFLKVICQCRYSPLAIFTWNFTWLQSVRGKARCNITRLVTFLQLCFWSRMRAGSLVMKFNFQFAGDQLSFTNHNAQCEALLHDHVSISWQRVCGAGRTWTHYL